MRPGPAAARRRRHRDRPAHMCRRRVFPPPRGCLTGYRPSPAPGARPRTADSTHTTSDMASSPTVSCSQNLGTTQPATASTRVVSTSRSRLRSSFAPELGVGPWGQPVLRAAMPETAVDEHRDLRPPEDDVGATPQTGQGRDIDPVPQAPRVQRPAHPHLRACVASTVTAHDRPHRGRRRPRGRHLVGAIIRFVSRHGGITARWRRSTARC